MIILDQMKKIGLSLYGNPYAPPRLGQIQAGFGSMSQVQRVTPHIANEIETTFSIPSRKKRSKKNTEAGV